GYLEKVEAGETLVITRAGTPVAEIQPGQPAPNQPRPFALSAGEFTVPEGFDAPLLDELPIGAPDLIQPAQETTATAESGSQDRRPTTEGVPEGPGAPS